MAGSADLFAFVIPTYHWGSDVATPLYGHLFDAIDSQIKGVSGRWEAFVGFPMLLLAAVGLMGRRRPSFVSGAAVMAAVFFILALGPALRMLGRDRRV